MIFLHINTITEKMYIFKNKHIYPHIVNQHKSTDELLLTELEI